MGELKVLSGKGICQILEIHGFKEARRKGSHVIMQMKIIGSTITVPVPGHEEIKEADKQAGKLAHTA